MADFRAFSRSSAEPAAFRRPALVAFYFKYQSVWFPEQTILITLLINFGLPQQQEVAAFEANMANTYSSFSVGKCR